MADLARQLELFPGRGCAECVDGIVRTPVGMTLWCRCATGRELCAAAHEAWDAIWAERVRAVYERGPADA